VEAAAVASLLTAVPAVALLAFSGRRHTGAARRAYLLLAAGGALAGAAALAGLVSALLMEHASHHELAANRTALGSAVAYAMALEHIRGILRDER